MPLIESVLTKPERDSQAREAHLIRTRDRLAYWRSRLEGLTTQNERALMEGEIAKYEEQLTGGMAEPLATPGLLQTLQAEVASLKTMLASFLKGQSAPTPTPTPSTDA